jgi:hypothetical protein
MARSDQSKSSQCQALIRDPLVWYGRRLQLLVVVGVVAVAMQLAMVRPVLAVVAEQSGL